MDQVYELNVKRVLTDLKIATSTKCLYVKKRFFRVVFSPWRTTCELGLPNCRALTTDITAYVTFFSKTSDFCGETSSGLVGPCS